MVKITESALTHVTKEVQGLIDDGKKPMIRLSMAIG